MAKVKFYKLAELKDWNAKYEGIYVQLTAQSSVKNGSDTVNTTFPAGLYFGSATGWVRLDNTDSTSAASQIAALDVSGYVQAVDNLNATGDDAGKITIKGIKEVDGKISNDSSKDVTINIGAYVLSKLSAVDALRYKGTIDASVSNAKTVAGEKGDVYKVTNSGLVNGIKVEAGDMMICNADNTAAGDSTKWDIIQGNIDYASIASTYAVMDHASTNTSYGVGKSDDTYGHVKLKTGDLNGVAYEDGVAAAASHTHSQYASSSHTHTQYAPTNHASGSDSYGLATDSNTYGHVKLQSGDLNDIAVHTNGIAASAYHTHSQYASSDHNHDSAYVKKNSNITASTTFKLVTYDAKGLVTGGKAIEAGNLPDIPSNKIVGMTDYSKPQSAAAIASTDTLNAAIGKLECKVDDVIEGLDWLTTLA